MTDIEEDLLPDPQALAFFRSLDLSREDLKDLRQLAGGLRLWQCCRRARCLREKTCARRDVICAGERFFALQRLVFEPIRQSIAREEREEAASRRPAPARRRAP